MFGFGKKKKESEFISDADREMINLMATLERYEEVGLLAWNPDERRLYIDEMLALFYMSSAEAWQNFLGHCFNWTYYRQCNDAWQSYTQKQEMLAVREAKKRYAVLTKKDIILAKQDARERMALGDVAPVRVEGFEFLLCSRGETEKTPQVEVLGTYHPDSGFSMTDWQEVKELLNTEKE